MWTMSDLMWSESQDAPSQHGERQFTQVLRYTSHVVLHHLVGHMVNAFPVCQDEEVCHLYTGVDMRGTSVGYLHLVHHNPCYHQAVQTWLRPLYPIELHDYIVVLNL
jgi:hypothetical protein